jgi:hypothetical protein
MADVTLAQDAEFVTQVGPLHVDWPRSVGYFGGIAIAIAFDLIAPEIALFAAVIPIVKLFRRKDPTKLERAIAAVIEGAAKPLGGDAEAVVHAAEAHPDEEPFWEDRTAPATH